MNSIYPRDSKLKIGITTRISDSPEMRDCLAHDWPVFFEKILPEADWMMLPNLGDRIENYIDSWGLNSFIISGGNDLGEFEAREETESRLIELCLARNLPLLGICRGFQLICRHFNARLERAATGEHPVQTHQVVCTNAPFGITHPLPAEVNSYHDWLVKSAGDLKPFAKDLQGNIEGVYDREEASILGLGWHPERWSPAADFDCKLLRRFFLKRPTA